MKYLPIILSLLIFLAKTASATIVDKRDYELIERNPLVATIAVKLLPKPKMNSYLDYELQLRPPKENSVKKLNSAIFRYFPVKRQMEEKNLVVVMSGLGGVGRGSISNFLSADLSKQGFHAVSIPNSF